LILVTLKIKENKIVECIIKGHGGGVEGTDIVCAAVSAISQTALAGLLHYGGEGILWEKKKGHLKIKIDNIQDPETQKTYNIILNTLLLGLKNIANQYPERIIIKVF